MVESTGFGEINVCITILWSVHYKCDGVFKLLKVDKQISPNLGENKYLDT